MIRSLRLLKQRPTFHLKKLTRNTSQAVQSAKSSDEPLSDVHLFKVGTQIHGFTVTEVEPVEEFKVTAIKLIHDKTKAQYLHLYRNDSNNVFCVAFRTTPTDSTGVPHILEHTVLCGSTLYPVRDPFFKMLNRSLATFMNAMTGSDYTMYPFSTQNIYDYRNLQKIYLDATFNPNLHELDFMQEGWRLENVDLKNPKSEFTVKGVVYNEMKGSFSENENILAQRVQNLILPDGTYSVVSGGDPLTIPDLTYQGLVQFHRDHYHPSNCRVFSYGNFPLTPSLEYVNNNYFSKYEYQQPQHTMVAPQVRWTAPQTRDITCRFDVMGGPIEKQNTLTISLLLNDITNNYDLFLMQFVSELLIRGPSSPFYKSMIEPNFSGGYTTCTGFDNQLRDCVFTVGLQGLKKEDFGKVSDIYNKTISDVVKSGFDPKHIESVLHRYELGLKHETSNFGLHLLFGITALWNHDGNVIQSLKVNDLINQLKENMAKDSKYLQNVVEQNFKNNPHRLILSMSPDKDFETKQSELEKKMIKEKSASLSDEQKDVLHKKSLELQKQQAMPQNTDLLPSLTISDISNEVEHVSQERKHAKPIHTLINKVNTNGIVYFRGILNCSHLSPEQKMLLPLFCYVITKLGTKKLNYREFENLIDQKTSGLSLSPHVASSLFQLHTYEQGVLISSYCLEKNLKDMFELWSEVFSNLEFKDVNRFKTLVNLYVSNLTHGIARSGHGYAMQAAAGLVSGTGYHKDLLNGLQHIGYMKRLVKTNSYEAMLNELKNISSLLLDKNKLRCCLNILPSSKDKVMPVYETFISGLPGQKLGLPNAKTFTTSKVWTPRDSVQCQHHVFNFPVHFCSKAILVSPYTEPDYPKLRVLAKLLTSKYLHPELRERHGAYGGGARVTNDGVFVFYSYRDPRNLQTLDVFDKSFEWMHKELKNITDQEILEAKLGVFQAVDTPTPPSRKGVEEFTQGLTRDILMRHRADLMTVDIKGLNEVAEKYFASNPDVLASKVVLGPKSTEFNTSKRKNELWTLLDKEM